MIALSVGVTGCGDAGNACVKGDQKACACPGGAPDGVQVCLADGTWGECGCGGTTTTGTAGAGGSTGGNSTGGMGTGGNGTGGNSTGGTGGDTGTTTPPMPCEQVFQGSFTIQNTLDIDTIDPYCEINGDLTITGTLNGAGLAQVALPNLRKVDGKVLLEGTLTSLSFPALESAQAFSVTADTIDLSALRTLTGMDFSTLTVKGPLALPALETFVGSLYLMPVGDVSLPVLTTAGGLLVFPSGDCPAPQKVMTPKLVKATAFGASCLTQLDVPMATDLGDLAVWAAPGVTLNMTFPKLTTAYSFDVSTTGTVSAPELTEVTAGDLRIKHVSGMSLGKVKTVAKDLWVYGLNMPTLSLPALESIGGYFKLGGSMSCFGNPPPDPNPALTGFDLPKLATLGVPGNANWIDLGPNPALPQCRLDALTNQLKAHGWTGYVFNEQPNVCVLAAGPCP
ncbi:MAG: hypothetical protein U0441_06035 [Polyangiaceae bacterium]